MKKILSLVLTLWFCTCCAQNIAKTKKKIDVDYSIIMSINNDSTIKKIVNKSELLNDLNKYFPDKIEYVTKGEKPNQ